MENISSDSESPVDSNQVLHESKATKHASVAVESDPGNRIKYLQSSSSALLNAKKFNKYSHADESDGGITLEFENASLHEVVELVIGKILKKNYIIDPSVKGTVTLRTTRKLNRKSVVYMLENILDIYNYRLVRRKSHFVVLPRNNSMAGTISIGRSSNQVVQGYGFHVVPLEYITATEMEKVLKTITDKGTVIRAHDQHNVIIVGGTSGDVKNILDTILLFDVNTMKNTNIALIEIRYSSSSEILKDIEKILETDSNKHITKNVIDIQSIDRLNSLMVITRQRKYIAMIDRWVSGLDKPGQGESKRLYVYNVKNSSPDELVSTLNELFSEQVTSGDDVPTANSFESDKNLVELSNIATSKQSASPAHKQAKSQKTEVSNEGKPKIIAANDSNALLISATPEQYARIQESLDKLDLPPLQVLIEVSIMDVRLSDDLSYGIQWFFEDHPGKFTGSGQVGAALNFPVTFSYSAVRDSGNVRALIGMLAAEGKVDVLSSPTLLVRNNKKASIRIGDQQPITTAVVGQEGNLVATSVQFKDTGVILEIEPTVTSSGMVNVDITQEVTDVGDIDEATGQRAFLRRSLKSSVSVLNGETIVLGGLIRTNKAVTESGVPLLKDIPILGYFFGKTITSDQRTELVIMLSPRVIRNQHENDTVFREFRQKFRFLNFNDNAVSYK